MLLNRTRSGVTDDYLYIVRKQIISELYDMKTQ